MAGWVACRAAVEPEYFLLFYFGDSELFCIYLSDLFDSLELSGCGQKNAGFSWMNYGNWDYSSWLVQ